MTFDADAFRLYLIDHGITGHADVVSRAGLCVRDGITSPEMVDERLGDRSKKYRAELRRVVRRYAEFEAAR